MTISINAIAHTCPNGKKHYKENNAQNPKDNFQDSKSNIALIESIRSKMPQKQAQHQANHRIFKWQKAKGKILSFGNLSSCC